MSTFHHQETPPSRPVLWGIAGLIIAASFTAAIASESDGIQPITAGRLALAIKAGETGHVPPTDPIRLRYPIDVGMISGAVGPEMERLKTVPFVVEISSPFSRAARAVADAVRKYEPPPTFTVAALNRDKVIITVGPSSNMVNADVIEAMVLKRGDTVIRPTVKSITPTIANNLAGGTRQLAVGSFTFDFDAFTPTGPLTLVLVGRASTFEWVMRPEELQRLQ